MKKSIYLFIFLIISIYLNSQDNKISGEFYSHNYKDTVKIKINSIAKNGITFNLVLNKFKNNINDSISGITYTFENVLWGDSLMQWTYNYTYKNKFYKITICTDGANYDKLYLYLYIINAKKEYDLGYFLKK